MATAAQCARIFGCTREQAAAQYQNCAKDLNAMAAKANATGKKVRGYTAQELQVRAARMAVAAG